jgi:hypothetical protein
MTRFLFIIIPFLLFGIAGCGVYSFTGANIEGKNINIRTFENRARNIVPTLSPSLTSKVRSRILSQTGLAPINSEEADYDLSAIITGYEITVSGVQNTQTASQNRLTITVDVTFKNRLNKKGNFKQNFTRFADFPANQTLQTVEAKLIEDIGTQLADDIFNKAFVNW